MRPQKWWSIVLTMGLAMVLSPIVAQAGPHRASNRHVNRQAFHRSQPRGSANRWRSQPHRWQQSRGNAYARRGVQRQRNQYRNAYGYNWQNRQRHQSRGWQSQARNRQQYRERAVGWNGARYQRQQHPGRAYGWNEQNRQWRQAERNAWGRQGQPRSWQQPQRQAVGWNGQQPQWQQHRQSSGQGYRTGNQRYQSPSQNQENARPSYTPISYSGSHQASSTSSGTYNNTTNSSGQWGRSHGTQSSGSSNQVPTVSH